MNYADIKEYDVANGPGVRVSLFVSGCNHGCPGCFNKEAWDFNYGKPFTDETIEHIIKLLAFSHYSGITFLGGEPFEKENQSGLLKLAKRVKKCYPDKNIWCYTGFDFDKDICGYMRDNWPDTNELLSYIDILVDGKFIAELKDMNLRFRGSSNQRIIDVPKSLAAGNVVNWSEPWTIQSIV